jgi:hypothetical protein
MKKNNRIAILISLSFVLWLGVSITQPIIKIFNNPSTFDYISMLNNLFIISAMALTIIPKAIKKNNTKSILNNVDGLDLKLGNTKNKKPKSGGYGCKSCGKKNKK